MVHAAQDASQAGEVGRVAVIVNPISGTGGRLDAARQRAALAAAFLSNRGIEPEVVLTERPGHASDLARAALQRGVPLVMAWGGDGTINEIASVLAFTPAVLGIVPSGSGNGLARELQIPFAPSHAFRVALDGDTRCIDAGELDGRLFFNVAGMGLDARVAHRFAAEGLVRRGFRKYLEIGARELAAGIADDHTVIADGEATPVRAMVVAIANSRQYGNGALIAPDAKLDDGRLDLVVIGARSIARALVQVPRLFMGQIARVPGVTMRTAREIEIISGRPVVYHVDGEPHVGAASITARCRPRALHVRVPRLTDGRQGRGEPR
jgi:YegS/Rv2252/BmrU family lipid kinase